MEPCHISSTTKSLESVRASRMEGAEEMRIDSIPWRSARKHVPALLQQLVLSQDLRKVLDLEWCLKHEVISLIGLGLFLSVDLPRLLS